MTAVLDDPVVRGHVAKAIDALSDEFRGTYTRETVERFVHESLESLQGVRLRDYVPLFAHRFARERLRAMAQAEGKLVKDVPEVLFVCTHNAGRSQMAAALLDRAAEGRVHVRSAGSAPGEEINPAVIEVMGEMGIDLSKEFPKPMTDEVVRAADAVITMGCGDACPIYPGKRYEDWELTDPAGQDAATVRDIRDEIDRRVQLLLRGLVSVASPPRLEMGAVGAKPAARRARLTSWPDSTFAFCTANSLSVSAPSSRRRCRRSSWSITRSGAVVDGSAGADAAIPSGLLSTSRRPPAVSLPQSVSNANLVRSEGS